MNLYQRINEVRKLIDYIQKDKQVSTGASGSYKAVTHDQVTALVRDHMVTHGIISYPVLVESTSMPKEVGADMVVAKQFRYEATYDFHFVNADEPSDSLTIRIQAHAMDNADKAPGKALSYAKKYAILKLFEIETGEDDESRYQEKETFNLEFHSELIRDAKDAVELKSLFDEAKKQAIALNAVAEFKALSALTAQMNAKFKGAANATN
jgi:hypothetical protein